MSVKNDFLGLKDYFYRKDAICIFCDFLSLFYLNHRLRRYKGLSRLRLDPLNPPA